MSRQMTKSPPTFTTLHPKGNFDRRTNAHQKAQNQWTNEPSDITTDLLSKEQSGQQKLHEAHK